MLEIKPVHTAYEKEEYCKACGFAYAAPLQVIAAFDNGSFSGAGVFSMDDQNQAEIVEISLIPGLDDWQDLFLTGKALLNYLDLKGVKYAVYRGKNRKLALALLFQEQDGAFRLKLDGYFDHQHPCG